VGPLTEQSGVRIELLGVTAQQMGEPVDHGVMQEILEILVVKRPRLQWPPVHDDGGTSARGIGRDGTRQGDRVVVEDVGVEGLIGRQGWDVLDEKVDVVQLGHAVRLEVVQDVHKRLVEALCRGPDERDAQRSQLPTQPTAVSVPRP
jgi:hypothetical protein